jgi:hypothetical protein
MMIASSIEESSRKRMRRDLLILSAVGLAAVQLGDCYAQEQDRSQMSRQEWQARVEASRERIELMSS